MKSGNLSRSVYKNGRRPWNKPDRSLPMPRDLHPRVRVRVLGEEVVVVVVVKISKINNSKRLLLLERAGAENLDCIVCIYTTSTIYIFIR
jgi:hypothetical protein